MYRYSFGDGKDSVLNQLSAVSHVYHTNSLISVNVRLLASNECGVDSVTRVVTIKPDFIQPALTLSDSSLCGPGSITFTNTTSGALRYTWNFGDGSPVVNETTNSTSHMLTHKRAHMYLY